MMIGGGAVVGLVGLYFAWNLYSSKKPENVKMVVSEKQTKNVEEEKK
jgi:hypothetical protein